MKLCFASIRLSATIKMGDKDDRPFVVANWPDAREKGGGAEFLDGPKSVSFNFSFRKVDARSHLRRSAVAASSVYLWTVFTGEK